VTIYTTFFAAKHSLFCPASALVLYVMQQTVLPS